ncbi:MAG: hypothetical protein GXZ11_04540 [Tissierellia bacterium]|nr:hypothetical protein [Tissierellia bacterium]
MNTILFIPPNYTGFTLGDGFHKLWIIGIAMGLGIYAYYYKQTDEPEKWRI